MNNTYKQSFHQHLADNTSISVFNCGSQQCDAGYTWGPGARDHYLIHLVISGQGSFTVQGVTYPVKAGEVFWARPGQRIQYAADRDAPWEYKWVGFNGTQAYWLASQLPFTVNCPVHTCSAPQTLAEHLDNIYAARGVQIQHEAMMVGHLYLFLACLMQDAPQDGGRSMNAGAQYVFNAVKYIQFHYFQNIGIDDIAKAVGISRSHLYRVFMSNVGQSPIDYLTAFRIEEACKLLRQTALSISEIAVSVGFFDQFYFSRVFKKIKGVPPSRYLREENK